MVVGCLKVEYDASIISLRSDEGMTWVGMKRERILCERSANDKGAHAVCQSAGSEGMCVGM